MQNGTVQPLIIAAGGGGASDQRGSDHNQIGNAKGLIDPKAGLATWQKLVATKEDVDAGKAIERNSLAASMINEWHPI